MRHAGRIALAVVLLVVVELAIVIPAYQGLGKRQDRRERNAQAFALAQSKIAANVARIGALAESTRQTCEALNTDAERINAVIDYFEAYSKAQDPGPATDAFFELLPRPELADCTVPTKEPAP